MLVFRTRLDHAIEGLKGSTDVVGQVVGERVPARVQEKPSWHGLNGFTEFDRSFGRRHFLTKWLVPSTFQTPKMVLRGFPVKPIEAWAKKGTSSSDKGLGIFWYLGTLKSLETSKAASHKETFCFVVGQIGSLFSDYITTTAGQKKKKRRWAELQDFWLFDCLCRRQARPSWAWSRLTFTVHNLQRKTISFRWLG